MKKVFLLIVVPALLVALGFAQTPATSINTDQTTIKGCLGGSDGNYTVVEDNTGHIFKIATSSVDLKPHLSHDVTLVGHKASGASSTPAGNSFAVTEVNMISEHCAAAAAASAAPVITPSETATTPAAAATPPAATATTPAAAATPPAATASTPAADATPPVVTASTPAADATPPVVTASTPAADATPPVATVTTPAETAVTPTASTAAPVATVSTPSETASTPAARPRRRSETPAATAKSAVTASSPAETASTPAATAVIPVATDSSSPEPVSTPAPVATTPAPTSKGWSLWLLIAFGVLVLVGGTMFPFVNRWRKQKSLEQTGAPNLSFTREPSSDHSKSDHQSKSDEQRPRKAA